MNIPDYWKTQLNEIEEVIQSVKKGRVTTLCKSAGGRDIHCVMYGIENDLGRSANLSSALGAGEVKYYADKTKETYRPTLFLVGSTHGAEFEGAAVLLNLINLLENGVDYRGVKYPYLKSVEDKVNLIIIPCINPDGRARVPFKSMVGKSMEELRYYDQGQWKDGSLCTWPECKSVHPMQKEKVNYMGGYFNDDGVNLMHDSFFVNPSAETLALMKIVDEYAPDFTILFHGCTNGMNHILKPAYAPDSIKEKILQLEENIKNRCDMGESVLEVMPIDQGENDKSPASFNLISALYHICGEPCITYETHQGLSYGEVQLSHDEIYTQHIYLLEEVCKLIVR